MRSSGSWSNWKKQKRRFGCPSRRFYFFPLKPVRRSLPVFESWRRSHVHASDTDFCIPNSLCGEPFRSAPLQVSLSVSVFTPVPLGFCCGGFSSTAGYVPGNEARVCSSRRISFRERLSAPSGLIISLGRLVFLSPRLSSSFDLPPPSLSASAPSVPNSGFPLLLLSNGRVTATVPPLGAGQSTRKQP